LKIKFMGGSQRVTGSCFLLEADNKKILIDCGLFQGDAASRGKNHEPFAFNPSEIEALIVTHSHIDHIGRIPKLFRDGFKNTVYSTNPTRDFAEIFLEDTLKLLKNEIRRRPEHELIWDKIDLENALNHWKGYDYHQKFNLGNIEIEFLDAGHILGSAMIKIIAEGKTVIFSGDLGNPPVPIIEDTEKINQADYIIMETTYGDRIHERSEERVGKLEQILDEVEAKKGVLLIPAFAMEKTQELLYELNGLSNEKKIGKVSFFVDSPLAIRATAIYSKYENYFDKDAKEIIKTDEEIFDFPGLTLAMTPSQSRQIANAKNPKVIMAGSGMSTGGRILGHEQLYLSDPNNTILFVGFQVKGTLGRKIKDGEKIVNIMGVQTEVKAEVKEISAYSSHADQIKLIEFVKNTLSQGKKPTKIFLIHGEPESSEVFAEKVKSELHSGRFLPLHEFY